MTNEKHHVSIMNLKKYYPIERGLFHRKIGDVRAVDDITLKISKGETLGLVGESGCGKTTLGRSILRALEPTEGQIYFTDENQQSVDVMTLNKKELRSFWRNAQIIFQDPYSSINPRKRVMDVIGEPLMAHKLSSGSHLRDQVAELLTKVGLRPEYMLRYPHAFSGGQRQRIGIARALALGPSFLVCDEAVSALDVSVQAQILNLLVELQNDLGLTYLFISHDLSVVEHISDRVAVMYVGKIVELGPTQKVFSTPLHPYTRALLSAVPKPDPTIQRTRIILSGEVPSPANPPTGCHFHPRCSLAKPQCQSLMPELIEYEPDHWVRCHQP